MFTITPKIHTALQWAALAHDGQQRKISGAPYIMHPFAVAWMVSHYTVQEDVIIAALLHDIIEDVDNPTYSKTAMIDTFGQTVCDLVLMCSEDKNLTTWRDRKQKYIDAMPTADPRAVLIMVADKVHNITNVIADYHQNQASLAVVVGDRDWVWFMKEVYNQATAVLGVDHFLVNQLGLLIADFEVVQATG